MAEKTEGTTIKARTGCGGMFITLNDSPPQRFAARLGKSGSCARCQVSAHVALIELALAKGVTLKEIADAIGGIRCHLSNDAMGVKSCPDAIAESFGYGV